MIKLIVALYVAFTLGLASQLLWEDRKNLHDVYGWVCSIAASIFTAVVAPYYIGWNVMKRLSRKDAAQK